MKKNKKDNSGEETPTREQLIYLREIDRFTREQIAERYDVSVATVRRWIRDHEIPRPSHRGRSKRHPRLSSTGEIIAKPDDGILPFERAKIILGNRLKVRNGGHFLDGRPVSNYRIYEVAGITIKNY